MSKVQTKELKIKLQKKRVTIVTLDPKTHTVPKRKARDKLVVTMSLVKCLISTLRFYTQIKHEDIESGEIMCRLHNDAFITDD